MIPQPTISRSLAQMVRSIETAAKAAINSSANTAARAEGGDKRNPTRADIRCKYISQTPCPGTDPGAP